MKIHSMIASAIVAGAVGILLATPSEGASRATTKPLQLSAQAHSAAPVVRKKRKIPRAARKAPAKETASKMTAEEQTPVATDAAAGPGEETPLPVVMVRTTREPGDESAPGSVPIVSADEFNELDRAAAMDRAAGAPLLTPTLMPSVALNGAADTARGNADAAAADSAAGAPSLLVSIISNYIGGPVAPEEPEEAPQASAEDVPAEAKEAFAAEQPEPQPAMIALEYILVTFGGALAAAAAIRVFVV